MVLVVFGIIAVHQFGGKTYACNDGDVTVRAYCVGWWVSQDDGILRQRVWSQPFSNFDNLGAVSFYQRTILLGPIRAAYVTQYHKYHKPQ